MNGTRVKSIFLKDFHPTGTIVNDCGSFAFVEWDDCEENGNVAGETTSEEYHCIAPLTP